MRRLTIIISSLLALAAVAAVTRAGDAPAAAGDLENGITVQGTASVTAVPDRASLWIGVESQGETARAALAANAAEMRRVLAALKAAGATDLQTQYVSVSTRLNETGGVQGYSAHNSVSATVPQLARVGAVIDAAAAAGANQISGPSLTHSDPERLYRQALAAAVDGRAHEGSDAGERGERLARTRDGRRRGRLGAAADAAGCRQGGGGGARLDSGRGRRERGERDGLGHLLDHVDSPCCR